MPGTVIITGANGSLGLEFVRHFVNLYPDSTLIATVRNTSPDTDPNTAKLHQILSQKPNTKVEIEALDLGILDHVRAFAYVVNDRVTRGDLPPISAIVCNAFCWSLNGLKLAPDGREATFQVSHLAHYLLVLKLLGSMDRSSGRVVMLGSTAHDPGNPNPLSKLLARIPEDIDDLVHPPADETGTEHDRGFQRYATAKLANVAFMFDLNRRLKADEKLSRITVTAVDPGGLVDSRAHTEQRKAVAIAFNIISCLMPLLRYVTSAVRTSADSGRDLVELSVGPAFSKRRGYFEGRKPQKAADLSQDRDVQDRLWDACWKWSGMSQEETVLSK